MQRVSKKFSEDDVRVVTIHSPEFLHEKDISLLAESVEKNELLHPVYIDNRLQYFEAIKARGWPSIYLIDKRGDIRFVYLGETHSGFAQARDIERKMKMLLEEK